MLFNVNNYSINISDVIYVSPASRIPEKYRKGKSTHSFKILLNSGYRYCYYNSMEAANKARATLVSMLNNYPDIIFFSKNDGCVDAAKIEGFTNVIKINNDELNYAIKITVNTLNPKDNTVWFKFNDKYQANLARSIIFERLKN